MLKGLLRGFSYMFHGLLALFLLAISSLALLSGGKALRLDMLPWSGATLSKVVLIASVFGLATLVLALRGKWQILFFAWSVVVAGMLLKGYIFSTYKFSPGELSTALYLIAGALLALPGAWFALRSGQPAKRNVLPHLMSPARR